MESLSSSSSSSTIIPFKSRKPLLTTTPIKSHPPVGPSIVTPDRVTDPSARIRSRNSALKGSEESPALLTEKYEMLCELFNALVSSIRLLRSKRVPATLTKLSRNIESLTDRRFTLHHLAQLKHIVPEVIVVKKIRVQDDETSCMKEELLISLETDAVETDTIAKGDGYSHLKRIFHSRIVDFSTTHPKGDDVPEGELPELFYKRKQESEPSLNSSLVLVPTTLMGPSFKRRFSSRVLSASITESSPAKVLPETPIKDVTFGLAKDEYSVSTIDIDATPVKMSLLPSKFVTPAKCDSMPGKFASTPVEVVSTPARLMSSTPALRTPKRSLMTDDDTTGLLYKSAKRRALRFDESCDDVEEQSCQDDDDDEIDVLVPSSAASKDLLEVLPENLVYSLMEKERITLQEQDPVVSQAKKRQQLMAGVLKLFDMIQVLFQSIRRSVMTKEELIHKIILGHLDIVDKGEVDEQLKLLQEVAPEFVTEQSCLSGDTLIRLNKSSCDESVRAKLLAAK